MKTFLLLLFLAVFTLLGIVPMSSCTKLEDAEPVNSIAKALITGKAMANLDLSNDTNQYGVPEVQWEYVPAGTKLLARVNSMDLDPNPDPNLDYKELLFISAVEPDGSYSLEVYAAASNTPVVISADQFRYDQKVNDSTYKEKIFTMQDVNISVISNVMKIRDVIFEPAK